MDKTWERIPGLSTGCGVFLILRRDMLVIRVRFSEKNGTAGDDRSVSALQGRSILRKTEEALSRPDLGWDVVLAKGPVPATLARFDPERDSSRPGGPGIVRYEIKQLRFLLGLDGCRRFRASLEEALDLWTVSGVMES